jgi:signal transduction histidine kinase
MKRIFSLTSLRVQAVLWTLLPLTVILVVVGSVGIYAYNEVVSRLVQDRDSILVRVSADRLSQNMENHANILEALAENEQMRSERCVASHQYDPRGCFAEQASIYRTAMERGLLHKFDGGVTIYDANGVPKLSAYTIHNSGSMDERAPYEVVYRNSPQDQSFGDAEFFIIPRSTLAPYFSDIIDDAVTGERQVVVSVPIISLNDEFIGVLSGSFLLKQETLGAEINHLGVGTAYLVDRTGRVIWHGEKHLLGADYSHQKPVRALLQLSAGANARRDVDAQGESIVVGYAPVQATGWGLVIQEPWATVIGPVGTFQWLMLGALLVGLMLVMVIISSGTRRLTEPIQELVSQTQQLARGDYVGQVQGGTIDEMRALSGAFNEMADRVARYRVGLQSYVAAITHSQEEERKRIARELHDDTIQSLIALGRRLELLEQSLENPIEAAKQLYQLQQLLSQTVAEVRQFSRDLRPLLLEDLGLEAALRQMLRELERDDQVRADITIQREADAVKVDDELEVALYRIAQEALNNIRKHSNAQHITMVLSFESSQVRLIIHDDGQGFSIAEADDLAQQGSFGLMGMRERTKLFGGTFELESTEGQGTRVEVCLPLKVAPEWVLEEFQVKQVALAGAL